MFIRSLFVSLAVLVWPLVLLISGPYSSAPLFGQTVFNLDQNAIGEVVNRTAAYPDPLFARVFQNKGAIVVADFEKNLTALLDPNNYFFGFHPREMLSGYLNLVKFPFVTLPIFVLGFLMLPKHKHFRILCVILGTSVLGLSFLKSFDRLDFILYFPLVSVFVFGVDQFSKKTRWATSYFLFSLPLMLIELVRQVIIYAPK